MTQFSDGSTGFQNPLTPFATAVIRQTGQGIFVYDGTPAAGTLIASIAAVAGTDAYGNAYPRGISSDAYPASQISHATLDVIAGLAGLYLNPATGKFATDGRVGTNYNTSPDWPYLEIESPSVGLGFGTSLIRMFSESAGHTNQPVITITGAVKTVFTGNIAAGTISSSAPGKIGTSQASSGNLAYSAEVDGDSVSRFVIRADGLMGWGSGGATRDTNLYRSAANYLTTDDAFSAASHVYGVVSITPVANTPTSTTISGLTLPTGLTYYGYASARTTVIGSTVQGVAATSASATGVIIWVYRTNTTNTNVDYQVVGQ